MHYSEAIDDEPFHLRYFLVRMIIMMVFFVAVGDDHVDEVDYLSSIMYDQIL